MNPTWYDLHPYPGEVHPAADPARALAAIALAGLRPPPTAQARVLDLGCGDGAGLIAFAARWPGATCVGVDASEAHVHAARAAAARAGVDGIRFLRGDIADAPDGTFDVVIAWSVFSWVDVATQGRLLDVAASRLAPDGALILSANHLPGWHPLLALRAMARFHVRSLPDPSTWPAATRALVDTLADAAQDASDGWGAWLSGMRTFLEALPDAWFIHDLLVPDQHPVDLASLSRAAAARGLRWFGDAPPAVTAPVWPDAVRAVLDDTSRTTGDPTARAQIIDLLLNRRQRASLFTRRAAEVPERAADLDLRGLWVGLNPNQRQPQRDEPLAADLRAQLEAVFPARLPADAVDAAAVLDAWRAGVVDLSREHGDAVRTPGEAPRACPAARAFAGERAAVPSRLHHTVRLSDLARRWLVDLDGARSRAELAERWRLDDGVAGVEEALRAFADAALLIG
jgi:SAM-dependent methyltransferase